MNILIAIDTDWLRQTYRLHYHYLAKYLTDKGYGVYVVDFPTHWKRTLENENCAYDSTTGAYVFRPNFTHLPLIDRYTSTRNADKLLEKIAKSIKIDLVISGGITYTPSLIRLDKPIIYFPLDLLTEQFINNYIIRQIAHGWENELCEVSEHIYTLTENMKVQLIRRGIKEDKIGVVDTGIDLEAFSPTENPPNNPPTILYLGAIRRGYGLENFVRSKKHVETPCEYRLVGYQRPENYGNQLKALEETIVIDPPIPHSEVPNVIEAADICMLTLPPKTFSNSAFPIKLLEYMAMAKPVISTRLNGIQSKIKNRVHYCDASPIGFAEAIDHLLSNPEKMKKLGTEGREYAEEHTWDKVLAPIEEALKGLTR